MKRDITDPLREQKDNRFATASSTGYCSAVQDAEASFVESANNLLHAALTECQLTASDQTDTSDVVAAVAGGAMSLFGSWAKAKGAAKAASKSTSTATSSFFQAALSAASIAATENKKQRELPYIRIKGFDRNSEVEYDENSPLVLCVNGFMTEGKDPSSNWAEWTRFFPKSKFYNVQWPSGKEDDWEELKSRIKSSPNLDERGAAREAVMENLHHLCSNPWHKAQARADLVGKVLANVLARDSFIRTNRPVVFMGHSLGSAVIYSCLTHLSEEHGDGSGRFVSQVFFLAGAFIPGTERELMGIHDTVIQKGGSLLNVYSEEDQILSRLFRLANLTSRMPAGSGPVCSAESPLKEYMLNIDVHDLVPGRESETFFGHSYSKRMEAVLERIAPFIVSSTSIFSTSR